MLLMVGIFVFVAAEATSVLFENMDAMPVRKCLENPMPEFSGRISERKCEQYLWEKQQRIKKEKCINPEWGVTNGISSNITKFPHMAAIGWKLPTGEWEFSCGGSLISHHFVLTAAHCTASRLGVPKIVRLGATIVREDTHHFADKPIDIQIKRILKHKKYRSPKQYFDIALLELSEEVNFTNFIQPACLWTEPDIDTSEQYFVSGWGQIAHKGQRLKDLQSAEIKIVENCENLVNYLKNRNWRNGLQDHQVCAGGDKADTCQGDSGGPLQLKISKTGHELDIQYKIVAITSFGKECGKSKTPGIYTKVFNFIDWIEEHVWPETSNPSQDQTVNDNTNGKSIEQNWFVRIIPESKQILDKYLNAQSNYEDNLNGLNWLVRLKQVPAVNQALDEGELELNNDKEINYPKIKKASTQNREDKKIEEKEGRLIFPDEILNLTLKS